MTTTFFFYKLSPKIQPPHSVCYIGKTRDPKARLAVHKTKSLNSDVQLYKSIRENGGFDNWSMEIIDICDLDESQARQKEQLYYQQHNANLNTCRPNGDPYATLYYQKNKEELRVKARERYTKTKNEWKYPKKSSAQLKHIHLKRIERTGKIPTPFTCEKHKITPQEIEQALKSKQ